MVAQDTTNQQITPYKAYFVTHIAMGGWVKNSANDNTPLPPLLYTHTTFSMGVGNTIC